MKQGRERVTNATDPDEIAELRRTAPDVKESMEIGLETGGYSIIQPAPMGVSSDPSRRPRIQELLASSRRCAELQVHNDQFL